MTETAGAVNVYTCPKGHRTITRNRNEGTTPFMLRCRNEGCDQMAQSGFYRVPQDLVPALEWIAPTPAELESHLAHSREAFLVFSRRNPHRKLRWQDAREDIIEHVKKGGLLLRVVDPVANAPIAWA